MGNELVRSGGSGSAAQPSGEAIVEPNIRELLGDLYPRPETLPPALIEVAQDVSTQLAEFLPKGIGNALSLGFKKRRTRQQFRRLLARTLIHTIHPNTPFGRLQDVSEIAKLGALEDIAVSFELANQILSLVPKMLCEPRIEAAFHRHNLARYHLLVQRRVRTASAKATDQDDQRLQLLKSDALSALISLQGRGELKKIEPILQTVAGLCKLHIDEPRQALDVNLMLPVRDKRNDRTESLANADARRAFGDHLYDRADIVLRVRETTNPAYRCFWVPVFNEVSAYMPGAALAFRTLQPQVVFTRVVTGANFGTGNTEDDVLTIIRYLSNVPFKTFLSFPICRNSDIVGVLNINLEHDEIKLMDKDEVLRLHHVLRPFFAAIEACLFKSQPLLYPSHRNELPPGRDST